MILDAKEEINERWVKFLYRIMHEKYRKSGFVMTKFETKKLLNKQHLTEAVW